MIKVYRIRSRYPAGSVSEILLLTTVCRIYLLPDTAKVLGSIRTQNSLYNDESVLDPTKVPGLLTLNLIAVCQIYIQPDLTKVPGRIRNLESVLDKRAPDLLKPDRSNNPAGSGLETLDNCIPELYVARSNQITGSDPDTEICTCESGLYKAGSDQTTRTDPDSKR